MDAKRTPFFAKHIALGAKMVEFAGYKMPMFFSGIVPEHLKVRGSVGMFDLSHMGEFYIKGQGAMKFISRMTTNDPTVLEPWQCQYSALCYEHGGFVDDLLLYKLEDNENWMMVVNASNLQKDWEWLKSHLPATGVEMTNISDETGLLAIQGPKAPDVLAKMTNYDLDSMKYYHSRRGIIGGVDVLFSRTGYTGEDGFEIYIPPEHCEKLWDLTAQAGEEFGIAPIGLGARDTLRLEMKYALYGNDIDDKTNPWEAGLGWIVKLEKGDFIGREALIDLKTKGVSRRLICFKLSERGFPRHGYPILKDGKEIGVVTSGTFSPSLDCGIGLGYVQLGEHNVGNPIQVLIRDHPVQGFIEQAPLYKHGTHK